jgi:MFS family permease
MSASTETVSLFSHRSFFWLWITRVFANLGTQIQTVAIGWQVYQLTHSAFDLGLVGLVQFLPSLLLTLVVGQVADRYDRRKIVLLCQTLEIICAAAFVLGSWQGWLTKEWIFALVFVFGIARAFQTPSASAMLPSLIPTELLPRAISASSAAMQAAFIVGPALGGFLYIAGPVVTYSVCILLFIAAWFAVFKIQLITEAKKREPVTKETLFAGIHFIRRQPVVLGAISLDLFAVLLGGATALLPIFASEILHVGPWGLGILRSAPAVGALLMSVYLSRWAIENNTGKVMFASVAVFGLATIVFGLSENFLLSLAALLVLGASDMISMVIRSTMVQLETPDAMRGRVNAVNWLFIGSSNQLGEFESGVTAALFGTVPAVVLGGAGTLVVVGLWMRWFPELVRRDKLLVDPAK